MNKLWAKIYYLLVLWNKFIYSKFTYSPLGNTSEKQTEKQVEVELRQIGSVFPTKKVEWFDYW